MKNIFEVTDLFHKYPHADQFVLSGIQLRITAGSFNLLLGQNGSGKSSLMRCLAGIQPWTTGEILFMGQDRNIDYADFNHGLYFISEDIQLPNYPLDTLAKIYNEVWGDFDRPTFDRIIGYGKIASTKAPLQLSRGQKALAQFALTLAAKRADILLVDEITAVLDPYVRARVVDELVLYNREKAASILVATNIVTEFANVSTNAILIEDGKIYLQGTIEEIASEFTLIEVRPEEVKDWPNFVVLSNRDPNSTRLIGRKVIGTSEHSASTITLEEIFIFLSARRPS